MSAGIKFHKVHVFLDHSSAQHKLPHVGSQEVRDALAKVGFSPRFKPSFSVNRKFDIPYLCGYDTESDLAYFDKDFDPHFEGRDATKYLLSHEEIEKKLESTGWTYEQRHHIATHCERVLVEGDDIDWNAYTRWTTHSWHAAYAKWRVPHGLRCPATLDMSPYVDEDDKLIGLMRKAGAKDKGDEG